MTSDTLGAELASVLIAMAAGTILTEPQEGLIQVFELNLRPGSYGNLGRRVATFTGKCLVFAFKHESRKTFMVERLLVVKAG